MKFILSVLVFLFLAAPATAQKKLVAECNGPFGRNATHNDVVKAFGAANVRFMNVPGGEGTINRATVIYPGDPWRRVEIIWINDRQRRNPRVIYINSPSDWLWVGDIHTGTSIPELERRAGRPFLIVGYGEDGGPHADLQGTQIDRLPGGCRLGVTVSFDMTQDSSRYEFLLKGDAKSNDPRFLSLKPRIDSLSLSYE